MIISLVCPVKILCKDIPICKNTWGIHWCYSLSSSLNVEQDIYDFQIFRKNLNSFFQNNSRNKKARETCFTPLDLSRQDASNGIKRVVLSEKFKKFQNFSNNCHSPFWRGYFWDLISLVCTFQILCKDIHICKNIWGIHWCYSLSSSLKVEQDIYDFQIFRKNLKQFFQNNSRTKRARETCYAPLDLSR